MSNRTAIADDYYINRLSNALIFAKHDLKQRKKQVEQERIFLHLNPFTHGGFQCEYCEGEMRSNYLGKNSRVIEGQIPAFGQKKELVTSKFKKNMGRRRPPFKMKRHGIAYRTSEGYRVSIPFCSSCDHKPLDICDCIACVSIMQHNALDAGELIYSYLMNAKNDKSDQIKCTQLLNFLDQLPTLSEESTDILFDLDEDRCTALCLLGLTNPVKDTIFTAITMVSRYEYDVDWEKIGNKLVSTQERSKVISLLQLRAWKLCESDSGALDVLETWESLAQSEAISVLEYYCEVHSIYCSPGEKTNSVIKRSLNRYGLAQTARYISNAIWRARKHASEQGLNRYRAFSFIYGNLCFWVDDPRARTYNAPAFNRSENVLCDTRIVSLFSRFFLEANNASYFSDPISINSLLK